METSIKEFIIIFGPYFGGLTTIIAWLVAYHVYESQKSDEKMKAAVIIMTEIRNAENSLGIIQNKLHTGATDDFPSILWTNNWKTFGHLFAKDFDQDELQIINKFYNDCLMMEELAMRNNNFFWITTEERARITQKLLGNIAEEHYDDIASIPSKQKLILDAFNATINIYAPQKTLNGLEFYIKTLQKITPTAIWVKLKNIANY